MSHFLAATLKSKNIGVKLIFYFTLDIPNITISTLERSYFSFHTRRSASVCMSHIQHFSAETRRVLRVSQPRVTTSHQSLDSAVTK